MSKINRLGLGCMGMSKTRNYQSSLQTIHAALDSGVTLLNTGAFYQQGDSEIILGEALKGVSRDCYFLSVKFGVLPQPSGGIYGLDVEPSRIPSHLTYSLRRPGLDYIDLYQPARMDTAIPVEEIVGSIAELVKAGFVKHIGLSMVDAQTLRRAHKVHPIHTVEMEYSLLNRGIETELMETAKELGVNVLAFGTAGHGLLTERVFSGNPGRMAPDVYEKVVSMADILQKIANRKGVTLSQLVIAWSLSKYDHVQSLIGTTSPDHLMSAIAATEVELTPEDIAEMEAAVPKELAKELGMRNYVFTNGKMSLA